MGISKPSLFGYRSGKIKISPKAWSKLEQLESPPPPQISWRDESSSVREDEVPYRFTPMAVQCLSHPDTDEGLRPVLERIAKALEKLVEMEERRNPKP
jgi:hypothetical protein